MKTTNYAVKNRLSGMNYSLDTAEKKTSKLEKTAIKTIKMKYKRK